jgi:hypothetical protein
MTRVSFIAAAAAFAPIVEAEYNAALEVHEDNPRLNGLGDLGNLIAACLADAPAQSLEDMAHKAVVLKIQLPEGRTSAELWNGADAEQRLAWSMSQDALRLATASAAVDPALAAAQAYHRASDAYNADESEDDSVEAKQMSQAIDDAAAAAYRIRPTTKAGIEALFGVMMRREAGCEPDLETFIALDTLKAAFAEVTR